MRAFMAAILLCSMVACVEQEPSDDEEPISVETHEVAHARRDVTRSQRTSLREESPMKKEDKKRSKLGINRETIKELSNDELKLVPGGDSLKTMCMPTLAPGCTGGI